MLSLSPVSLWVGGVNIMYTWIMVQQNDGEKGGAGGRFWLIGTLNKKVLLKLHVPRNTVRG
jgi:hypothetical protein